MRMKNRQKEKRKTEKVNDRTEVKNISRGFSHTHTQRNDNISQLHMTQNG